MRLVHAADLHLDSPLTGLSRLGDDAVADELRRATRGAMENLVRLVLDERADVLVLAGDLYDGDWRDYATGRYFVQKMDELHEAGVKVVAVSGNHDAESEITRSLRLPPSMLMLSTDAPQTEVFDDLGLAVHGQGYATRAVRDNLAGAYRDRVPGVVNVGLLHTSVAGQTGHEPYAPCTLDDLLARGYEYFALGHVHRRQVLHEGRTTVAYSGNLQGRHPRETGPKGALVVDLEVDAPARVAFRELDVARWETLRVDVTDARHLDEAVDEVQARAREEVERAGGRRLAVRVELTGATPAAAELADDERVREEVEAAVRREDAVPERVRVRVRPPRGALDVDPAVLDAVRHAATVLGHDPGATAGLMRALDREMGRDLREAGLDLRDDDTLGQLLDQAVDGLLRHLAGGAR